MKFDEIVRMPQHTLKKELVKELNRMGYKTQTKKGFTYAKGKVPVLLVAHLDTVHKETVKTICYSDGGTVVMSPEGIGGDDRAGIYMIMQIIKKHRCHVLFCEDEEIGGIGAHEFARSGIRPNVNYIVELDRHGSEDAVFYDCDNREFTTYVEGFGFAENFGTFSDISVIAPELGVAAVNISAGYYNEHTRYETVNMEDVARNIARVGEMVSTESKLFEYIECVRYRGTYGRGFYEDRFNFADYYGVEVGGVVKTLMTLPETAYLRTSHGRMLECDGRYMIDSAGRVHEYVFDLDVAVEAYEYEAVSEHGLPARFELKTAEEVEVVPMEFFIEMYDEDPYYQGFAANDVRDDDK